MYTYPKKILSIEQQICELKNAGMILPEYSEVKKILSAVGYYRLRGYSYHLYDNKIKKYKEGTKLSDLMRLYGFDGELSEILFGMISEIEVALRVRFVDALLIHNDALILNDPSIFVSQEEYWKNQSTLASEISRSHEIFIMHNYKKYDGAIPVWAAVEVISFGTLARFIKNLKPGAGTSYAKLSDFYLCYSKKGNQITPSKDMLTSWINSVATLRNICAHNGRIYNRSINTIPKLCGNDAVEPSPKYSGLYQIVLAMKYLRPDNESWNEFSCRLVGLIERYNDVVELGRIGFPDDWKAHLVV